MTKDIVDDLKDFIQSTTQDLDMYWLTDVAEDGVYRNAQMELLQRLQETLARYE